MVQQQRKSFMIRDILSSDPSMESDCSEQSGLTCDCTSCFVTGDSSSYHHHQHHHASHHDLHHHRHLSSPDKSKADQSLKKEANSGKSNGLYSTQSSHNVWPSLGSQSTCLSCIKPLRNSWSLGLSDSYGDFEIEDEDEDVDEAKVDEEDEDEDDDIDSDQPLDIRCQSNEPIEESPIVSHKKKSNHNNNNNLASNRKIRRNRTVFTELQLMGLERRFDSQKYLSTPDRAELARILGLTQLQVKTWYQVMQGGCPVPPTKPKGRPKKNSIPSLGITFDASLLCSTTATNFIRNCFR